MMGTLMILGGMLMMLSPLLPAEMDESAFVGTARALRGIFNLRKTPANLARLAHKLDDVEGTGE